MSKKHFTLITSLYTLLLLIVTAIACFFSYQQKKQEFISQIDMIFIQLGQEYRDVVDNFWQIYMPFFESNTSSYDIRNIYFEKDPFGDLSPFEKKNLEKLMKQMLLRNDEVQWVVLYNPNRSDNYILYKNNLGLTRLTDDFPFFEALNVSSRKMQIYGAQNLLTSKLPQYTFAVCGGISDNIGVGKILAGYTTTKFYSICSNSPSKQISINYVLSNDGEILFDSSNEYDAGYTYCSEAPYTGVDLSPSGQKIYIRSQACGTASSLLTYYILYWELFSYCHSNTIPLLLVFLVFMTISILIYFILQRMVTKEIAIINDGLVKIGENNLDYRITEQFVQSGLPEIAASINQMTLNLKHNINRAYYYEIKQREAELAELQSKFNPHFLYNTLEMLRSRCQKNGDETVQELITQMAAIFRGFIGSKTFIPLTDELAFSQHYLALFGARYEDMIEIRYDFDKEILEYGIIRNIFQPLIENYFVHGFDTSNEYNYILFKGKSLDNHTMLLTVEDNGSGMTADEMKHLNACLHEPIKLDIESYGLKNLHQRLQLFYGQGCGLIVSPNSNGGKGLSIEIRALKITCEEYEKRS